MNEIKEYTEKMFDDIKHIDEFGNEYWLARELQSVLQYTEWRKFKGVKNSYERALESLILAKEDGLRTQMNVTITSSNLHTLKWNYENAYDSDVKYTCKKLLSKQ